MLAGSPREGVRSSPDSVSRPGPGSGRGRVPSLGEGVASLEAQHRRNETAQPPFGAGCARLMAGSVEGQPGPGWAGPGMSTKEPGPSPQETGAI